MIVTPYSLTLWPMVFPAGIAHLAAGLTVVAAAVGASMTISIWGWVFSAYTADKISLFYGIAIVIANSFFTGWKSIIQHPSIYPGSYPAFSFAYLAAGNLPASRDVIPEETGVLTNPIPEANRSARPVLYCRRLIA